jgi:glycine/D-amino acid oxidase-like deaminating enzyme
VSRRGQGRAIVIGGGVMGVALAYRLAAVGHQVVLTERQERLGAGTSDASFAIDVTSRKTPRAYFELSRQAADAHRLLADEVLATPPWLNSAMTLEWGESEHDRSTIAARVTRLQAWGYDAAWMTPREVRRAEPGVRVPEGARIARYVGGAWYDPQRFIATVAARATEAGAEFRTGAQVVGLSCSGDRVHGVELSNEDRISADVVVICAGAAAGTVAGLAGVRVPLQTVAGVVGVLGPPRQQRLRSILLLSSLNVRPGPAGKLVLHSYPVDAALPRSPTAAALRSSANDLRARLQRVLPDVATIALDIRVGLRPVPADGLPVVGEVRPGLYLLAAHSGVHLAPVLSSMLAMELVTGRQHPGSGAYRPGRDSLYGEAVALDESLREMHRMLA